MRATPRHRNYAKMLDDCLRMYTVSRQSSLHTFRVLPINRAAAIPCRRLLRRSGHQQAAERHPTCFEEPRHLTIEYDRDSGIVSVVSINHQDTLRQQFQTIIGIEIHAQLKIPTKLFSSAPTKHFVNENLFPSHKDSTSVANTLVDLFDLGYPGTLPRLSFSAVRAAIHASAALNCHINPISRFERKHYAYADLPLGYQVTQQRWPIASDGRLRCRYGWNIQQKKRLEQQEKQIKSEDKKSNNGYSSTPNDIAEGRYFTVGIDRIQLEQDSGKTTTVRNERDGTVQSLIDLNRAGCALIEIVFRPDIRSAHQAAACVATLQQLLRHIHVCDGKMEEGSLRCDLNVSIAPIQNSATAARGADFALDQYDRVLPPNCGKRVEVKNLNSIRQVISATEYEGLRQAKAYCDGVPTDQETRTFDPSTNRTVKIRSKEGAVDYRFMPEPDMPPLVLNKESLGGKTLDDVVALLPELPGEATHRLMNDYGLNENVALVLVGDPPSISFFEESVKSCLAELRQTKKSRNAMDVGPSVANWLCNDLFGLVKECSASGAGGDGGEQNGEVSFQSSTVSATQLGSLVAMIIDETISTRAGKNILSLMYKEEVATQPREIAEQQGWRLIKDTEQLQKICEKVVFDKDNEKQLFQYLQGGNKASKIEKYFVGKSMAESKGNAHPDLLLMALREVLESRR